MTFRNKHCVNKIALWLALALTGCGQSSVKHGVTSQESISDIWVATVELTNPSNFPRLEEPVHLSFYDLGLPDATHLVLTAGDEPVTAEAVDTDGDGVVDGVLGLLDFRAGQTRVVKISRSDTGPTPKQSKTWPAQNKRTQAEISVKQGGQWVPRNDGSPYQNYEGGGFVNVNQVTVPDYYTDHSNWIRYEGPGIESDMVGYRIYLDGRNGFDIFGKSVAEPVLQQVGQDGYESYHHPQDWGLDILKVGNSLGAGGFGYWAGDKLVHLKTVGTRSAEIVQDGDLFSSFKIQYQQWQVAGRSLDVTAYFSMHAGSRLVKNQLNLSGELDNLAIGLVAHPDIRFLQGPQIIPGDAYTYIASWGPQSLDGKNLGMAIFFRKGDGEKIFDDGSSHIVLAQPAGGKLTYYFAAAWEGELGHGVRSLEEFQTYLAQQAERLTRPVRQRLTTRLGEDTKQAEAAVENALLWSRKMANSELKRKTLGYHFDGWDVNRKRKPKFEYDIVGLLPLAYDELAKATGDNLYNEVKSIVTASYIAPNGTIQQYDKNNFNIDSIAPGRTLLRVYQEDPQPRYKTALAELRDQLRLQPKTTNGAFWHKQIYPGQLWLDGVFMGMPFLTEYALLFEKGAEQQASLDAVMHEFEATRNILRDPVTGLYFHAWDETKKQDWADPASGLSANFWGRGAGWLAMALVDVLEIMPASRAADRATLQAMILELAKTLEQYQDSTGTWWQIMDRPGAVGNYRESTATAMFTYFLAKAANLGYLTEANFGEDLYPLIVRSYRGLVNEFILVHADGSISMTGQCHVAGLGYGRDGSYDYYMNEAVIANDPKGTGPFILAGIEVDKVQHQNPKMQHQNP